MKQIAVAHNKRGASGIGSSSVVGGILLIVVGSAFIYIGLYVNNTLSNSIDRTAFTAAENTSFEGIGTNVRNAFSLIGVSFIVMGAAVIIMILRGAF